jgi:hypothetical protein
MPISIRKEPGLTPTAGAGVGPAVLFLSLLACLFLLLEAFVPLGTAVKIGADEDFEPY